MTHPVARLPVVRLAPAGPPLEWLPGSAPPSGWLVRCVAGKLSQSVGLLLAAWLALAGLGTRGAAAGPDAPQPAEAEPAAPPNRAGEEGDDAERSPAPLDGESADVEPSASPTPFGPLRIASWHLQDAKSAGALAMLPDLDRAWRHTFGAERRTAPTLDFDAAALDADVVLLQGVRRVSDARLLFPARQWRLVVSRQMLGPVLSPRAANRVLLDEVVAGRPATTAIAVRFKRGLRVGGQIHITDVVMPVTDPVDASAPRETPAALAVRVLVDRKPLWAVSVDLAAACTGSGGSCAAFDALSRWQGEQSRDQPVVIGGTTAAAPGACAHQSLAMLHPQSLVAGTEVPAIGCLARMRWP